MGGVAPPEVMTAWLGCCSQSVPCSHLVFGREEGDGGKKGNTEIKKRTKKMENENVPLEFGKVSDMRLNFSHNF